MSDKLTTDNYHYRLDQLHREEVMRADEQQHLAQIASGERKAHYHLMMGLFRSVRQFFSRHPLSGGGSYRTGKALRHTPHAILIAVILTWAALATALPSRAQALIDPGQLERNPERIHYGVGIYFQLRGNYERAIQEFTAAIEIRPQMGDAYAARADSYVALRQYARAIDDYTQALALHGDDPFTCAKRAFTFAALGDLDAAQQDFGYVISLSSEYPS
jgi:tetratricopeptide (TPR) repeat protein